MYVVTMGRRPWVALAALAASACSSSPRPSASRPPPVIAAAGSIPVPAVAASAATRAFRLDGFAGPDSVLYDEFHDRYFVANLNGAGPGFISIVDPYGKLSVLRWVEGDRDGVTLRDPHGMAIFDGLLWVADGDTVRTFYLTDGKPGGDVAIPGATFLNDLDVDRLTGKVYVSGADAVWLVERREARPLARGKEPTRINGISVDGAGGVWVAGGEGAIYHLDAEGTRDEELRGPGKSLGGVALLGRRLFVSDVGSSAVYERTAGGFAPVVEGVPTPADIAVDSKRKRLLVPCVRTGTLEGWDLVR